MEIEMNQSDRKKNILNIKGENKQIKLKLNYKAKYQINNKHNNNKIN